MLVLRSVRRLDSFLLRMIEKNTSCSLGLPSRGQQLGGRLAYCLLALLPGGRQPGSICFGYRRVRGREPELKVRVPAAEASPAMHLLVPPSHPHTSVPSLHVATGDLWFRGVG